MTELASALDSVDRQARRPEELRWIRGVVNRARSQSRHDPDAQGRALGRLIGATPTPLIAPAAVGANTITKLVAMALWCTVYPVPSGFDSALVDARDATVITVVAAAGASELMIEQGCRSSRQLHAVRTRLAVKLGALVRHMPIGDASLQAAAMLAVLHRTDLLPVNWSRRVVDAQRSDGSWPAGTAPGSTREVWRATVWAVRALVAQQLTTRSMPRFLAESPDPAPPSRPLAPPRRQPAGILRPEDRQALHALGLRSADPITEPSGGTPFGNHGEHHMAPSVAEDPAVLAPRDRELAAARDASARLRTVSDAIDAGYVRGSAFTPAAGSHWIKWDLVDRPFDPAQPSMLLFGGDGADAELVGFSYVLRSTGHPPSGFAGTGDHWHQHFAMCFANGRLVGSDILSTGDCTVLGRMTSDSPDALQADLLLGSDVWMLHAWIVPTHPNPEGVFSTGNPSVQCTTCPPWLAGNELT